MKTLINWLKNAEKYEIKGRGTVYAGPAPFSFERDAHDSRIFNMPWVISHPDACDCLWRVVGLEAYCIPVVSGGMGIGLLVEPWDD